MISNDYTRCTFCILLHLSCNFSSSFYILRFLINKYKIHVEWNGKISLLQSFWLIILSKRPSKKFCWNILCLPLVPFTSVHGSYLLRVLIYISYFTKQRSTWVLVSTRNGKDLSTYHTGNLTWRKTKNKTIATDFT